MTTTSRAVKRQAGGGRKRGRALPPSLTLREVQVALGICTGGSYDEIGRTIGIACETVRSYANRLRSKTGLRRKTQLAVWVSENRDALGRLHAQLLLDSQED